MFVVLSGQTAGFRALYPEYRSHARWPDNFIQRLLTGNNSLLFAVVLICFAFKLYLILTTILVKRFER